MMESNMSVVHAVVVEQEIRFTLVELSHACRTDSDELVELVREGVLTPTGEAPQDWRFGDASLRRARRALSLKHDLQINTPGVALALDLLDEIEALRLQLRRRS
jgi:chaperone modulatory protein CbpM